MKKILIAFALLLSMNVTNASFVPKKATVSNEEIAANEKILEEKHPQGLSTLSVQDILALTPSTLEEVTGKKISFKDKLALKFVQRNIKRDLKKNGTVNLSDYVRDDAMRFNLGGFALGFFLGLIGVALAQIFSNNKSFRRSSWYGVGALLIIAIIVTLAGG